ncbi:hypothetical protein SSP35_03_00600 [Streptomyces sp. NBRC 110611]|nr:hypothetical protein SSP35_03_00600 [Streptomyces sp. NBRC 110611]
MLEMRKELCIRTPKTPAADPGGPGAWPTLTRSADMAEPIARCLAWVRFLLNPRTRRCSMGRRRWSEEMIDGDRSPLVRPYVVAYEQCRRRDELLPATFGVDAPGPYVIHGVEVA